MPCCALLKNENGAWCVVRSGEQNRSMKSVENKVDTPARTWSWSIHAF